MSTDLSTSSGRENVLRVALAAARAASKIVHAGFRKHPTVEHKGAIDLVTSYDRESERFLRKTLSAETPFAFIGEEEGGTRAPGAQPTWFVDPLDGTTNFVHGHPFYCVSVGLLVGAAPVLGVVVAPALATEWTGAFDFGATRASWGTPPNPCTVSGISSLSDALLATGFPYDRKVSEDNNFDAFVAIKRQVQAVRRCGSAALDLCLVGDGTYDGYWERKLKAWDLAGGAAIVRAAGGRISDFRGAEGDVTTGHLVATNGKIHVALLSALAQVPSILNAPNDWQGT
jgi:myo-inositol-1(or 4)-monophosphatase